MSAWKGRVFLGVGRMLYAGPLGATTPHAHHAFQVIRSLASPIRLCDHGGHTVDLHSGVIGPGVEHAIAAPCAAALVLYVEPETREGRILAAGLPGGDQADTWQLIAPGVPPEAPVTAAEARALIDRWLASLAPVEARSSPMHPALRRALARIDTGLDGAITLTDLAGHARLSPSRLSHLFADELGIGVRPFVLWRRLARVAAELGNRRSITEAAHAAGFADAAHLSRTFRRMVGLAPSDVTGVVEWYALDGSGIDRPPAPRPAGRARAPRR